MTSNANTSQLYRLRALFNVAIKFCFEVKLSIFTTCFVLSLR